VQADAVGYLIADIKSTGSVASNITDLGPLGPIGYSLSVMICMSAGLSEAGGRGLGTLGWPAALAHAMLRDAGFGAVADLDWESALNLFYLAQV
jgi:hypothetical protein